MPESLVEESRMTRSHAGRMTELAGSVAVVTGAGGGIGRALAGALAERGAIVWLVGRRQSALDETAKLCGGSTHHTRAADLTDAAGIDGLMRDIRSYGTDIDILVHCAGVIGYGTIEETVVDELDRQYRANVQAFYALAQRSVPLLRAAGGQIVVMNSSIVLGARAGAAQFAATQHALRAITDTLRDEVNGDGIRVLSVFPGRTATSRQEELYGLRGARYHPELLLQPADISAMVIAALELPRSAEVTEIHMRPLLKSY